MHACGTRQKTPTQQAPLVCTLKNTDSVRYDMASRAYDLVVWGASGFTGRLAADYLARQYTGKCVRHP